MSGAVITGANRGIGLELSRALKAQGWSVIGACRKSSSELEALGVEIVGDVEVGSDEGATVLAKALEGRSVDLLINCAGILQSNSLDSLDFESMRAQFEINSLGPLRITSALLPNLHEGSKVALITSRMGSVSDNTSGGQYGYRMSKCALNIAGASLAVDLRPKGIAVALLHPGFVRTEMTGGNGLIDATESAAGLLARIDELTIDNSGGFWHTNGEELGW
ncbi:MAG: SDR family oxidoreductase [Myxococcales bacterium]|nr:SDR family oxidoreductase [Myxococcales bacterium]